jgi:hypothetical protein
LTNAVVFLHACYKSSVLLLLNFEVGISSLPSDGAQDSFNELLNEEADNTWAVGLDKRGILLDGGQGLIRNCSSVMDQSIKDGVP